MRKLARFAVIALVAVVLLVLCVWVAIVAAFASARPFATFDFALAEPIPLNQPVPITITVHFNKDHREATLSLSGSISDAHPGREGLDAGRRPGGADCACDERGPLPDGEDVPASRLASMSVWAAGPTTG